MPRSRSIAFAAVVGFAALLGPICASVYLAWNESVAAERLAQLGYAADILRRSDETDRQMSAAGKILEADGLPPCSPAEIDLMRRIDLGSTYVQGVGRLSGDQLICTSLGTTQPIPVGPADLVSSHGADERLNVHILDNQWRPLAMFSVRGIAFIVDPALLVDVPLQHPDTELVLYVPSSPNRSPIVRTGRYFNPRWFDPIPKGSRKTFSDHGYIVTVLRSSGYDLAVVVATPQHDLYGRIGHFALFFVPFGLLCGIGLVWAVLAISHFRSSFDARLRLGARRGEFIVHYQPVVELHSRRWVGTEALVRWNRADGIIRPDLFIPLAEEHGLVTLITEQVFARVTDDLSWLLRVDPAFSVSINLSAADLASAHTVERIENLIRSTGAAPSCVELEATEGAWLQAPETREVIDKIRGLGCRVAIDDFGTGYSSLACLQSLRLDTLKIDKAFVETIGTDGATSEVILHIIAMAQSMNLNIVAEGVETEAQAQYLMERGVRYAQGWLFAKAMSFGELRDSLKLQRARGPSTQA